MSKTSGTNSDWEHDYVLACDGEYDCVNDDGGNADDRSWYGRTDLLGGIALYGLRIRWKGGRGIRRREGGVTNPTPADANQWRRGELLY